MTIPLGPSLLSTIVNFLIKGVYNYAFGILSRAEPKCLPHSWCLFSAKKVPQKKRAQNVHPERRVAYPRDVTVTNGLYGRF